METTTEQSVKFKTVLFVSELLAVRAFAGTDKSRFVLNSVYIEATTSAVTLVATDGRTLAAIAATVDDADKPEQPFNAIISTSGIDRLAKIAKDGQVAVELDDGVISLTVAGDLEHDKTTIQTTIVPGRYPDWREVIPKGENKDLRAVSLNPKLAANFHKAAKLLKSGGLNFGMYGDNSPISVTIEMRPHFFGVLMPMRGDDDRGVVAPDWLKLEA